MRKPRIHALKAHYNYYEALSNHSKNFELRKNDRNFQERDFLEIKPFDNEEKQFIEGVGREIAKITYILSDCSEFGLMDGYVILGLRFWSDFTEEEKLLFRLVESGEFKQ